MALRPPFRAGFAALLLLAASGTIGCKRNETAALAGTGQAVADPGLAVLGSARADLDPADRARFEAGRLAFVQAYTPATGLGPHFNDAACSGCHDQPTLGGGSSMDDAVRIVERDGDVTVLARKATPGFAILQPAPGQRVAVHRPPSLYGLGLLEGVPDADLIAGCDAEDRDGDGVRGHVNVNPVHGRVGRFGFKAHAATVHDFIGNALSLEMGITHGAERDPVRQRDTDAVPDPEQPAATVDALADYVRGLAPPPRLPGPAAGEALFASVGCATCHRPQTGPGVAAFTDLCLHDMGPELANGIPDFRASAREWRTAPLWGLRFRTRYLHDDRAATLEAAIGLHAGEATGARTRWQQLAPAQRADLVAFLRTL